MIHTDETRQKNLKIPWLPFVNPPEGAEHGSKSIGQHIYFKKLLKSRNFHLLSSCLDEKKIQVKTNLSIDFVFLGLLDLPRELATFQKKGVF